MCHTVKITALVIKNKFYKFYKFYKFDIKFFFMIDENFDIDKKL